MSATAASDKGGTTLVRRPRRAAVSSRDAERPGEPVRRRDDDRFDLAAWVRGIAPLVDERADEEPVAPRREPPHRKADARREPFDLTAWVHGLVPRVDEGRREEARVEARRPRAAVRREPFDLTAWVHGIARRVDEPTPAAPTNVAALRRPARPAAPPARKPLTLPDLFEGPAVPPCLEDE